jgi:hypothetical protein
MGSETFSRQVAVGFDQHVKVWGEQRSGEQQPRERKWCLCGQRIKHQRLCWVRRADLEHLRKRRV